MGRGPDAVDGRGEQVVLCDLDGVVWLAGVAIPGAPEAVRRLRGAGHRVLFVTNNSAVALGDHEAALAAIGIEARGAVVSSATAVATLVRPGDRVLACAGAGVIEALVRRGAQVGGSGPFDAVVVGLHLDFDYEGLRAAADAVRAGARLIGTNDDATFPTPQGPIPGGGAILAAVATAAGVVPEIAGKPHPPMATLVRGMTGPVAPGGLVMIGDRPSTDGRFAAELGARFVLVRSGVTPEGEPAHPEPWLDVADLEAAVDALLSSDAGG